MSYMIGQLFFFQQKQYQIIGKDKRSFILESEGKQYKATAEKIKKMEEQEKRVHSKYPNLEQKINFMLLWKKDAKIPTNEEECIPFFENLCGELSGENLSCDGELSRSQIQQKLVRIKQTWEELESICGRKVSEEEIESNMMKRILKKA